jgi:hypothetical protein
LIDHFFPVRFFGYFATYEKHSFALISIIYITEKPVNLCVYFLPFVSSPVWVWAAFQHK